MVLPSPWDGDPHLLQEEASFSAEESLQASFLLSPLWKMSRCHSGVEAACSMHLLLRFVQGCCAITASNSNIARSILYSFLDQLLLNHSIFVLTTGSFLSELFTTLPSISPF